MSNYIVIKKFQAGEEMLFPGDVVDTSDWKYTKNLVSLRMIRKAENDEPVSRVPREGETPVVKNTEDDIEENEEGSDEEGFPEINIVGNVSADEQLAKALKKAVRGKKQEVSISA